MVLNLLPRIIYYEETGRVLKTFVDIYPFIFGIQYFFEHMVRII